MCPAIPKVLLDLTTSTEIGDPNFGDSDYISQTIKVKKALK